MQLRVLGPLELHDGNDLVQIGAARQRALLAALALNRRRTVSIDQLVDLVWGDRPPSAPEATVQAYVSALRRLLEPHRRPRERPRLLITDGVGYRLTLGPEAIDADRFTTAVVETHRRLTPYTELLPRFVSDQPDRETLEGASRRLGQTLDLCRGQPFADLDAAESHSANIEAERGRLTELQVIADEDQVIIDLWLGRDAEVVARLERLCAEHPLRERLSALRALALARTGQQAAALEVLAGLRTRLINELGIEPGPESAALQTAILRQEPELGWRVDQGRVRLRTAPEPPAPAHLAPSRAPMIGRVAELAALTSSLERTSSGWSTLVTLIGEPGIGKTRLIQEGVEQAGRRGIRSLIGRCSGDDGAPPLWPWTSVLRELDAVLPTNQDSEFQFWDAIARTVRRAAYDQPLLLVIEDLHWADAATVRVLRLLLEILPDEPRSSLMLMLSWRSAPTPTGVFADLVELLGRRHATRIELAGLSQPEVGELVRAVTEQPILEEASSALTERTGGNPFFVIECARWSAESHTPPPAVHDVLVRRLDRLPDRTRDLVAVAGLIGRTFDLAVLAGAVGHGEDEVLDLLEPAETAGLLIEQGIDRFAFGHALVRDTATTLLSRSRRARVHARIARALEEAAVPGHESELAAQWRQAGPSCAAQAWSSTVAAAEAAARLHAHEAAVREYEFARLISTDLAPNLISPRRRCEMLLRLADACRWSGQWARLVEVVEEAIDLARGIGDGELLAQAAISTTRGALWLSEQYGRVNDVVVGALRLALDQLPIDDHPLRVQVMLALANELYYGSTAAERDALIETGLAMAGRLGDDRVLLDTRLLAFAACWRPSTAGARLGHAEQALALADRIGDRQSWTLAATLAATALGELGRVGEMQSMISRARDAAGPLQLRYAEIVLDSSELPWLAMAGRFADAEVRLANVERINTTMATTQSATAVASSLVVLRQWQGRPAETLDVLLMLVDGPLPVLSVVICWLLRAGEHDRAQALYRERSAELSLAGREENWLSLIVAGATAELAAAFHDQQLAAESYARLAPYAGRPCTAGSGPAIGPVDAFLAMAAATVGEQGAARRHAERAEQLLAEWELPLAASWFADQRVRLDS